MSSLSITESDVRHLLEKGLVDSAEYWSLLLMRERNKNLHDSCSRHLLYADCLFRNGKYEHAFVFDVYLL